MTMATTIEQPVALDEALVPSTKRLRIGKRNFRLPSDIQSKESTLQVVYDVLRSCPFFKAFLVTVDVSEIYMQEFWATVYVHQHSIRFKLDKKKRIVDLETFRNMLHICPRIPGQSFDELPFEAEILEFLRFLRHSAQIRTLTDFQAISSSNLVGIISQQKHRLCISDMGRFCVSDDIERGGDEEESKNDEESDDEETREEESFDPIPRTPKESEDDGDQEGPSAGSDRGSKRRREEEPVQTISQIEEPSHPVFETGAEDQPIVQTSQHPEWFPLPKKLSTPNRDWNKTLPAVQGTAQTWISKIAKQADSRSSFNELLDTPIDFSNFIMNRLRVDILTPELLAVPSFKLMRGSCNSLTELEYHLEEVYKATTDQLDRVNPEGQQYPHNLLQPFLLIPDNRGRRVIPFTHFINNNLEYLRGGASSRKYTTSVTKTKAADYGHIKWIEDLVPRTMWIHEPINYDKHALWGVSYWRQKRQQFYGFTINRESALDVYSKRRIISVIDLKIREEDLQLGVESYQYRLNLTKPDTYRSNLKRREAYTAYSNPRGFIYQNKDKKNRLMRIDKLYKLSDGTLNDVHNALDDRQKGIRMQYLPQTIWRKGDKDRAAAMIQAIDKMLKTRRIMRSLERFVGGRLYKGDFWMLQRTI
nr:hypothetical protein [Tanacetum cinerariifolium]